MDKVIENWDKILQTVKADYDDRRCCSLIPG